MVKISKVTRLTISFLAASLLLASCQALEVEKETLPPPNFMVVFIGDQGLSDNARAVLQLIEDEGADMLLHQGDLDYKNDPEAWDQMINDILGPNFPYFASIGNHDFKASPAYQEKLRARLDRIQGGSCEGDLGVKSACTYKGLFFQVQVPWAQGMILTSGIS